MQQLLESLGTCLLSGCKYRKLKSIPEVAFSYLIDGQHLQLETFANQHICVRADRSKDNILEGDYVTTCWACIVTCLCKLD